MYIPERFREDDKTTLQEFIGGHSFGILKTLIETHEAQFGQPWTFELPQDYIEKMMRGVVGFTLEITRLEGKFKMSQNRTPAEREKVIAALQDEHKDVAEVMKGLRERG